MTRTGTNDPCAEAFFIAIAGFQNYREGHRPLPVCFLYLHRPFEAAERLFVLIVKNRQLRTVTQVQLGQYGA